MIEKLNTKKWLTLKEAAFYCGISYGTARNTYASWTGKGVNVYRPFGKPLFSAEELDRMISNHRVN